MDEFNVPDSELTAFFQAVGMIVLTWGRIEQTFDQSVDLMYKHGGNTLVSRQPHGLKQRLKFVRKCFTELEKFKGLYKLFDDYLADTEKYSEERHKYIHSVIVKYSEESGQFGGHRLINRGHSLDHEEVSFNPDQFPELMKVLMDLTSRGYVCLSALGEELGVL